MRNVLVVQLGLMGDVLLMTPLLRRVRASLPAARITMVVPPSSRDAIATNPDVDVILTYDAFWADPSDNHRHAFRARHVLESIRFVRDNRDVEYDLIINCWVMDQPLTAVLLSFLRSKCLLGFAFPYSGRFYDERRAIDPALHIADNAIELFEQVVPAPALDSPRHLRYDIPAMPPDAAFEAVTESTTAPYLLIAPFSSESTKEWELSHWATVLNEVSRLYPRVTLLITGLANTRARSASLMASLDGRVVNAVGALSLPQFAHMMKHAAATITTESGAMHLASAFDVPVFVLFSQVYNYKQFLPYRVESEHSVVPVPCAGCIYGCALMSCMKHDVSRVMAQLLQFCARVPALTAGSD